MCQGWACEIVECPCALVSKSHYLSSYAKFLIENSGTASIQSAKNLHGNFSFSVAEGIFQFKTYKIISNSNVSEICLKVQWEYENNVFKKKKMNMMW